MDTSNRALRKYVMRHEKKVEEYRKKHPPTPIIGPVTQFTDEERKESEEKTKKILSEMGYL